MRPFAWLDLSSLSYPERIIVAEFLDSHAPSSIAGRNPRFKECLAAALVTGSDYFNLNRTEGRESWGVLATANFGAIVVPAVLAKATDLPPLPNDLGRIAISVGPVNDKLKRAVHLSKQHPEDAELQRAVIDAALTHADLHERLRRWHPALLPPPAPRL